jgi:hypothetical protein
MPRTHSPASGKSPDTRIITPRMLGRLLAQIDKACRPEAPHAIAAARLRFPLVNRSGVSMPSTMRDFDWDWRASNVQVAIDQMRKIQKTVQPTLRSYTLKCAIEHAAGEYISNGDCIVAAIYLGFRVCQPHDFARHDNPNVYIGVSMKDIARLKHEAEARRVLENELDDWERENLTPAEANRRHMRRTLAGYPNEAAFAEKPQILTRAIVGAVVRQISAASRA